MRAIKATAISILTVGLLAGSAVGVAAQGAVVGTFPVPDEFERVSPFTQSCSVGTTYFDDPRLTGDYEHTETLIEDTEGDGFSDAFLASMEVTITNADGSWSGHFVEGGYLTEDAEVVEVGGTWVFLGEGGYEGLAAVLRFDDTTGAPARGPPGGVLAVLSGVILEAEPME